MKKIQFTVDINAPKEKVWKSLWEDANYRKWTSAFHEGSYAVSDWKEGSKILFLTPEGTGMYSKIESNIPNEFMAFRHLGTVKNGKEEQANEETKQWEGAMESYKLQDNGKQTKLLVELNSIEDHLEYFKETFPKALNKLKEISEN